MAHVNAKLLMEEAVEVTAMAVRELLLEYFRDSCNSFVLRESVKLRDKEVPRLQYAGQRRLEASLQRKHLYVGDFPLFELHKKPDTIIFNLAVIELDPRFETIAGLVETFLKDYLTEIRREDNAECCII